MVAILPEKTKSITMKISDQIILSIAKICKENQSPFVEFYNDDLKPDGLAEICIFNFFYSWLFINDENLITMSDENILKHQLFCLRFVNEISGRNYEPLQFIPIFRDRYVTYMEELENFKNNGEFPNSLFIRLFKYPLKEGFIGHLKAEDNPDDFYLVDSFDAVYTFHINKLLTELKSLI